MIYLCGQVIHTLWFLIPNIVFLFRDLSVKRKFDNHPILWQFLDLISEGMNCKIRKVIQVYSALCHVCSHQIHRECGR